MTPTIRYAVYADLTRRLTEEERSAIFAAIDSIVPDSGCVGLHKAPNDEVYFSLDATSEAAARDQAGTYINLVIQKAALDVGYKLELQRIN